MSQIINYLKGTRSELAHVNWPTRRNIAIFTTIVIIISLLSAAYLGLFDFVFNFILKALLV